MTSGLRRSHRERWSQYERLFADDGRLDRDERLRILDVLLPVQNRSAVVGFTSMLMLSVTIAVMGLAANSAAVVIGAMLVAPLMTPIMTFAAAVALGLGRRAVQAALLVVGGSVLSIVLSYLLAKALPEVTLGSEVLARTRPDVRDLIVAVAAGTAGAYATARKDLSTALPGVAVAVALVPPLAATGILIEAGEPVLGEGSLAEGSLLLFVTNLLAIIVSALAVLLATGVIPTIRLCLQSSKMAMTAVALLVATVAISIPLTARSLSAAESSREEERVTRVVDDWLGARPLEISSLDIDGSTVRIELTGLAKPPPAHSLATALVPLLGADAEAIFTWDQRAQGTARAGAPEAADPTEAARGVVEEWLTRLAVSGSQLELVGISVDGDRVSVDVQGPAAPPAAPELPNQIAAAIGQAVEVKLVWDQTFDPGLGGEAADERLERVVRAWIGPRASVRLVATSIEGSTVSVDLGAEGIPLGLDVLRRRGLAAVEGAERIDIRLLPLTAAPPSSPEYDIPRLD